MIYPLFPRFIINILVLDDHTAYGRPVRTWHASDSQYPERGRGVNTDALYHPTALPLAVPVYLLWSCDTSIRYRWKINSSYSTIKQLLWYEICLSRAHNVAKFIWLYLMHFQ